MTMSAEEQIREAVTLVRYVRDIGIPRLDEAISTRDLRKVTAAYADCVCRLHMAGITLSRYRTIYDESLVSLHAEYTTLRNELWIAVDNRITEYR